MAKAPDIESIYGELGDFARQITRLESHFQANPGDRDAWLVLGPNGSSRDGPGKPGDFFLRISDRKPDAALAALLDATYPLNRAQ